MSFHFPLQALLHFRQSVEHQHELRLRAINQQVARVRRLQEQVNAQIRQLKAGETQELNAGTTAAEIAFDLGCVAVLQQHRQTIDRELARLEGVRDQQQRVYQQARREREILENLRNQKLEEYRRGALRREQRQLDDLFLLRRSYLQRG